MKKNHRSQSERITDHILLLQSRIEQAYKPYGRGNPYWYCSGCNKSQIDISIDGKHHKGCTVAGTEKEIEYYERLLKTIKNGSII